MNQPDNNNNNHNDNNNNNSNNNNNKRMNQPDTGHPIPTDKAI